MIDWWTNKDIDKLLLKSCISPYAHEAIVASRANVKNGIFFSVLSAFVIGGMLNAILTGVQQ